ncbi:MAG: hypothetical protein ACRDJV_07635 [Actinomycetota bacterium]
MNGWAVAAIAAAAAFTSGVVFFAATRIPRWRRMEASPFLSDFAKTIAVADKVQPALLLIAIGSTVMLIASSNGVGEQLALGALVGFVLTMLGSVLFLVPLQRRMIHRGPEAMGLSTMRSVWLRGHLARTALSAVSLAMLIAGVGLS